MSSEPVISSVSGKPDAAPDKAHHWAFFRQSGWMMIATVAGGGCMYAVHMVAKNMPKEEYGVFTTLLQVVTLMGIPTLGLQSVFAQQAAAALHDEHERELTGVLRGVLRISFFLWLALALLSLVFQQPIKEALKIRDPFALWMTVAFGLAALWSPVLSGMLQGRQNYLWLGWVSIFNGAGRFVAVVVIVGLLRFQSAAGAMVAVFLGIASSIGTALWQNRDCLRGPALPVNWGKWLGRMVPLTLGVGASTFMLSADMVFVQRFFQEKQTGFYAAAGMIGRALVFFAIPTTAVMFPKLVRSAARKEKTNVLALTLVVTALVGGMAAAACTIFPSLPLRIVYDKSFLDVATPLVPWFAWCMLPLTLTIVLINSLLARSQFAAVPWLVAVAAAYGGTLYFLLQGRHDLADPAAQAAGFKMVIQTLGVFSTLMLAVCAWFSWRRPSEAPAAPATVAGV